MVSSVTLLPLMINLSAAVLANGMTIHKTIYNIAIQCTTGMNNSRIIASLTAVASHPI